MRSTVGPERCWWSWYAGQVSERRRSARSGRVDRPISFSVPLRRLTLRVGFEVRSLQEFMAARALVAGDSAAVLEWLRCLAPSAHWRNTWLLAAGRAFTHHEHRRDPIVTLLDDLDTSNLLAMLVMPGARLAIDILADDIAIQAPRYRHLFAKRAMQLLASPPEAPPIGSPMCSETRARPIRRPA